MKDDLLERKRKIDNAIENACDHSEFTKAIGESHIIYALLIKVGNENSIVLPEEVLREWAYEINAEAEKRITFGELTLYGMCLGKKKVIEAFWGACFNINENGK